MASLSGGGNSSDSNSNNRFSEDVWGPQGEALGGLYDQASELYGGGNDFMDKIQGAAGQSSDWTSGLMDKMGGGMDEMMSGGSYGNTDDIRNQLMNSLKQSGQGSAMGDMYQSIVGGQGNSYIDPMVDSMKQGAMENNQMMQSGNAQDAASMGQGGGSRHAMQNAMTNRGTNQDMMNMENQMRGGAYDKDLAMKMGIAQQADSNMGGTQDRLMQMMQGSDANRQAGMGFGGGMNQMGQSNMAPWQQAQQSQWNPMQNWASILGGPTTLKSGSGNSNSSSKGGEGGVSVLGG